MRRPIEEFHNPMEANPAIFNPSDFIDTAATAKILGIKKGTLDIWRHQGKGPEFYKFGRSVRYYKPGLEAYAIQNRRSSTSHRGSHE